MIIEKNNIPLENKDTKKIEYTLWLDEGVWSKIEYNAEGKTIYYEDRGYWSKQEYDNEGNLIYYEDKNDGIIRDDRKTKHTNR